jgi:hypothetical protein
MTPPEEAAAEAPARAPARAAATVAVTDAEASPAGKLSAEEERLLGELQERQRAAAGGRTVRMKVESPHSEMHFGGVKVGTVFTEVPAHFASALSQAAAESGVTITQEG